MATANVRSTTVPPMAQPVEEVKRDFHGSNTRVNEWMGTTWSCFSDWCSCCYGTWCFPCMLCEVSCDAYDHSHESPSRCFFDCCVAYWLTVYCCPCTALICPQFNLSGFCSCFLGHVLSRFRNKYDLPPLPEGECGCYNKWCFPDCCQTCCLVWPCTVCLMYRQMKRMDYRGTNKRPYQLEFAYLKKEQMA
ncbi:hypothetical protein AAMO2058_000522100 [Amorphochlora amoebiformis]